VRTFCTSSRRPDTGRTRRRSGTWPPLPLGGDQAHAHWLPRTAESPSAAEDRTAPKACDRDQPAGRGRVCGAAATPYRSGVRGSRSAVVGVDVPRCPILLLARPASRVLRVASRWPTATLDTGLARRTWRLSGDGEGAARHRQRPYHCKLRLTLRQERRASPWRSGRRQAASTWSGYQRGVGARLTWLTSRIPSFDSLSQSPHMSPQDELLVGQFTRDNIFRWSAEFAATIRECRRTSPFRRPRTIAGKSIGSPRWFDTTPPTRVTIS
jgi:hypothetical protein